MSEWMVLYGCCEHFSRVTFTLTLRRNPLYYVINVVVPCCLLSVIAVFTYILQPSRPERLAIGQTSSYLHESRPIQET